VPADFTLVGLPDTQYYSAELNGGSAAIYQAQAQWAVSNRAARNIVYVAQLGDCVENGDNSGNPIEWQRAESALSLLEDPAPTLLAEGIPFGVAVGNHDQSPNGDPNGTTTFSTSTSGIAVLGRVLRRPSGSNNDNHDLFSASGMDFIVIHMEYDHLTRLCSRGRSLPPPSSHAADV
jgi:hypothetical protein